MNEEQTEQFIKIGITTNKGILDRFGKTHVGYDITKIFEHETTIELIGNIEQYVIEKFKDEQHIPSIKFGGYTECFDILSTDKILKYIKGAIKHERIPSSSAA